MFLGDDWRGAPGGWTEPRFLLDTVAAGLAWLGSALLTSAALGPLGLHLHLLHQVLVLLLHQVSCLTVDWVTDCLVLLFLA